MADYWEPAVRRPLCGVQRIGDELWFFGEIDESNTEDVTTRAVAEVGEGIVGLDLSQVRFFGAAGIRILSAIGSAATSPDGGMRVVCSPEVMRTLRVCRVTGIDGLLLAVAPEVRNGQRGARY